MKKREPEINGVHIKSVLKTVHWVKRNLLAANDYNPNKVTRANLDLLRQSIIVNGWTLPIVVRPDYTIIDGYHRWLVAGEEPLKSVLNDEVPVVVVKHDTDVGNIYGTVTHNRARGTHLLEPMKAIVKRLKAASVPVNEICRQLGMRAEEVFRLSEMTREDFLELMVKDREYSKAVYITKT